MTKQKTNAQDKRRLSWWQWALIIVAVLFIFDLFQNNNEYENCTSKCVDDNYYCIDEHIDYDELIITEYDAKMCHWELNDCELKCR